jgi:hypothetical protein
MVMQWKPAPKVSETELAQSSWRIIAEAARQAHHHAAAQEDVELYNRSQRAFLAALNAAYPEWNDPTGDGSGHILYNLWLDSMESLKYYVDQIAAWHIVPSEWIGR